MKEIVIASNNKGKIIEMQQRIKPLGWRVISQRDAGVTVEVPETGKTFEENAVLKAEAIFRMIHKPVISDDSGLEIDALDGQPGVYSHRFAGENATDEDRNGRILDLMEGVSEENRTARFQCVICYIDGDGDRHIFRGIAEGKIGYEPKGSNGFGFDPIFVHANRTFAEMTDEEKNQVSHRGKALDAFADYLRRIVQ